MPSAGAWIRGQLAAEEIIRQHQQSNDGKFPETTAVTLWGLDTIKTRGKCRLHVLHFLLRTLLLPVTTSVPPCFPPPPPPQLLFPGESIAIVLSLVGAKPVKEGTGRVVRFDLVSIEELGRPRIDVLASLSGIFRDSFANVVDLLDDMFERAASADEPDEMNVSKCVKCCLVFNFNCPAAKVFELCD